MDDIVAHQMAIFIDMIIERKEGRGRGREGGGLRSRIWRLARLTFSFSFLEFGSGQLDLEKDEIHSSSLLDFINRPECKSVWCPLP